MADEQQQACDCPVCVLRERIREVVWAYAEEVKAATGEQPNVEIAVRALAQVAGAVVDKAPDNNMKGYLTTEFLTAFGQWSGARVEVMAEAPAGLECPETKH
jgi:hypothetical protein